MIRGAIVEPTMKPTADGRDQRRVERRQAEDQLQVLRDEEEVADDDEDAQEVRAQRCAERADSEEAHVDDRRLEAKLAADEQEAEHEPGDDHQDRWRREAVLREPARPYTTPRMARATAPR